MLLFLLACASTPTPDPAPPVAPPSAQELDARVQAYAQEVERVCAERQVDYAWSPTQSCSEPGVGSQILYDAVASYEQTQRPIDPMDERNPTSDAVCEDIVEPTGLDAVAQGEEPQALPDPGASAIEQAAQVESEARTAYQADTSESSRQVWMRALEGLHAACLAVE